MSTITIKPGAPFWLFFTAFASNMLLLLGVDQLSITAADIEVSNWWVAVGISVIVGAAVYGKAKTDEIAELNKSSSPPPPLRQNDGPQG